MFENLKLSEFTWKREPILYLALLVALGNVALSAAGGELAGQEVIESVAVLLVGFFGRGQVSPS